MKHLSRHPSRQRGVTLIVMLVMLVVITLTSVAVMRGALNADRVSNNARLQASATQFAQIGLRYCEAEALKEVKGTSAAGSFIKAETVTPQWETFASWSGTTKSTVPTTYFAATTTAPIPANRPQCLAEYRTLADGKSTVVVVTARGFSADYAESGGHTTNGSVVWLQSISAVATDDGT